MPKMKNLTENETLNRSGENYSNKFIFVIYTGISLEKNYYKILHNSPPFPTYSHHISINPQNSPAYTKKKPTQPSQAPDMPSTQSHQTPNIAGMLLSFSREEGKMAKPRLGSTNVAQYQIMKGQIRKCCFRSAAQLHQIIDVNLCRVYI